MSMNGTFLMRDWNSLKKALGWSVKAYAYPLNEFVSEYGLEYKNVLEIGVGHLSATSLIFCEKADTITLLYYQQSQFERLNRMLKTVSCRSSLQLLEGSAFEVSGRYDCIVMKSVLGGIFRIGSSTNVEPELLISKLVNNNLVDGGVLVTIDNGATIFNRYLKRLGARKNNWRFFGTQDFPNAEKQFSFGFFSSFTAVTRFGLVGHYIDDLFYYLDRLVYSIFRIRNPSVILSIYRRQ